MPIPEFLAQLRQSIGHAEVWLPGVAAIVLKDIPQNAPIWAVPEVLLVQRADNGQWAPVTGILDPREQPHDGAVREVKEEAGLEVTVEALLGVGAVGPIEYPNGDVASYVETAFRCALAPGAPDEPVVNDDESTDVGWFSISQLPPMDPRFRLIIADAVAQMKHPSGFRPRMGFHKREA